MFYTRHIILPIHFLFKVCQLFNIDNAIINLDVNSVKSLNIPKLCIHMILSDLGRKFVKGDHCKQSRRTASVFMCRNRIWSQQKMHHLYSDTKYTLKGTYQTSLGHHVRESRLRHVGVVNISCCLKYTHTPCAIMLWIILAKEPHLFLMFKFHNIPRACVGLYNHNFLWNTHNNKLLSSLLEFKSSFSCSKVFSSPCRIKADVVTPS